MPPEVKATAGASAGKQPRASPSPPPATSPALQGAAGTAGAAAGATPKWLRKSPALKPRSPAVQPTPNQGINGRAGGSTSAPGSPSACTSTSPPPPQQQQQQNQKPRKRNNTRTHQHQHQHQQHPKGANTEASTGGSVTPSGPVPRSPALEGMWGGQRVVQRGHGRALDVVLINAEGLEPWAAGRGRPCADKPCPSTRSPYMAGRQSDVPAGFFLGASEHGMQKRIPRSPKIHAMINETPPLAPATGAPADSSGPAGDAAATSPALLGAPLQQPTLYDILNNPFEMVLETYPLFALELARQTSQTQMGIALDWSAPEKPQRLVATVETCIARGFFLRECDMKAKKDAPNDAANKGAGATASPAGSAATSEAASSLAGTPAAGPIKGLGVPRRSPQIRSKKVFDAATAVEFTPPLSGSTPSFRQSPSLDPKAASFKPPAKEKETEKEKEKPAAADTDRSTPAAAAPAAADSSAAAVSDKGSPGSTATASSPATQPKRSTKLSAAASEWTPTAKCLSLSAQLNARAPEWTPPSLRGTPARPTPTNGPHTAVSPVPGGGSAQTKASATTTPQRHASAKGRPSAAPPVEDWVLPCGPATFASQKKNTRKAHSSKGKKDEFKLYEESPKI